MVVKMCALVKPTYKRKTPRQFERVQCTGVHASMWSRMLVNSSKLRLSDSSEVLQSKIQSILASMTQSWEVKAQRLLPSPALTKRLVCSARTSATSFWKDCRSDVFICSTISMPTCGWVSAGGSVCMHVQAYPHPHTAVTPTKSKSAVARELVP